LYGEMRKDAKHITNTSHGEMGEKEKHGIVRAFNALPIDRKAILFMHLLESMGTDEIAMAAGIPVRRVAIEIRKGRREIVRVSGIGRQLRAAFGRAGTTAAAALAIAGALLDAANEAFPAGKVVDFADWSVRRALWKGRGNHKAASRPEIIGNPSEPAGKQRPPLFAPAAAALFALAASIGKFGSANFVPIATAAALTACSGVAFYYCSVGGPPSTDPVQAPPAMQSEVPAAAGDPQTEPPLITEEIIPAEPPAETPAPEVAVAPLDADPAAIIEDDGAYEDAVQNGNVVFHSDACGCGHVNPYAAEATGMNPEKGALTWTITGAGRETPLYSGAGASATIELTKLFAEYGDGEYEFSFTYKTHDGRAVTKSRTIVIDTGEITENQYE
jgi:hypothetical protein